MNKKTAKPAKSSKKQAVHAAVRERVAGLVRLPKSRLKPNPRNWRLHPENQRRALRGILEDVGNVDALLVRPEDPAALESLRKLKRGDTIAFAAWAESYRGSYMLADGHMRLEEIDADELSALVLDIDEHEEAEVLATLDPITNMAKADTEVFANLIADIESAHPDVQTLLDDIGGGAKAQGSGLVEVVDTTKLEEEFYMSIRGPLPKQPEAIERLRAELSAIPGVVVEVGIVG